MEKVESAAADTTSGSSPIPSSLPTLPALKGVYSSSAVSLSSSALPLAGTSVAASDASYCSIMHSSGKMVPIGIAHPVRKFSEEMLEGTSSSQVKLKELPKRSLVGESDRDSESAESCCELKARPVAVEEAVNKQRQRQSSPKDLKTKIVEEIDESDDSDSSLGSSSEKSITPPSLQQTEAMPSRSESVVSTRDSKSDQCGLPCGKKFHVFISHSTSDQSWVKRSLVVPLKNRSLTVTASYCFMPNASCYDDQKIRATIRESSVVVIGLSPSYLASQRCRREWELACRLAQDKGPCQVVVAAIATCNRPRPLKRFLYLDFISEDKKEFVWKKFLETIDETVDWLKQTSKQSDSDLRSTHTQQESQPIRSAEESIHDLEIYQEQLDANFQIGLASAFEADLQNWMEEQSSPESITEDGNGSKTESQLQSAGEFLPPENSPLWQGGVGRSGSPSEQVSKGDNEPESEGEEENRHERQLLKRRAEILEYSDTESGELVDKEEDEEKPQVKKPKVEEGEVKDKEEQVHPRMREMFEEGEVEDEEDPSAKKKVEEGEVEEGELSSDNSDKQQESQSTMVTNFYDSLAQPLADNRNASPILQLRSFNNWVKSILIRTFLPPSATVLDLCCGKGGDLLKWKEGGIEYLVCADISSMSVDHCKERYRSRKMVDMRSGQPPFEAEFIVADCCELRLRDRYKNEARRFHLTSCQFSLHYSFESYEKACMMLMNACENLRRDGYFIGTTVDSYELVRRLRHFDQRNEEGEWYIGNSVFSVTLDSQLNPHQRLPLFGAKYLFKLHGVVNLPEFVVYFPLLEKMLEKLGMELVLKQNFCDFFSEHRNKPEDAHLLYRMAAFNKRTGTMSAAEWEVAGLYLIFVFQKKR